MPTNESLYEATINQLVALIDERLKPIREDQRTVNRLCEKAALPIRYPEAESEQAGQSRTIRRDHFHAKPLAMAVKEYLQLRGPSDKGGLGAATVNEIFDALLSGGYKAETDDLDNAKRGLRITLTKQPTFYRVEGGGPSAVDTYGLIEWYPNARPQDGGKTPPKKKRGRPRKVKQKTARVKKADSAKVKLALVAPKDQDAA